MRQLTPSQIASIERHKSFHAAIAARAKQVGAKAVEPIKEKAKAPKPLPQFEPSIVWPVIPFEIRTTGAVRFEQPIRRIIRIVAQEYKVSIFDVLSERRNKEVIMPRHIAMYLAKELTSSSLPEIGRRFGNRDHTTALSAILKIQGMIKDDLALSEQIDRLRLLISGPTKADDNPKCCLTD